jgi:2-oxoisovalerate dehydrogenase E2 component (dihydrolipoyl transacylase)
MGAFVFKLPDVGEGIAEAEIVAWHVEVGQEVKEDQPLVDVMTDKATVEIGAPVSGRILSRRGDVGRRAAIGSELVVIETEKDEAFPAKPAAGPRERVRSTPAVSGAPAEPAGPDLRQKTIAAPAVRARAAAIGIDLATAQGTGPEGRVLHEDLDAILVARGGLDTPRAQNVDDIEEVKVIGLRRQIAERMADSKRRIPHFSYIEEVDVTALEALRADLNRDQGEDARRLTLLPFLIKAIVRAVARHPAVNALFDDESAVIRRFKAVHVGVATQTPRGLVVPVIRQAAERSLWDMAAEIQRLSTAARAGKATRAELTGSTITVSSLGALGGIAATPIINPPEVAVIGVNRIVERPVMRDGRIVPARMMNLSSSFDHRVVDGFDAAAFINEVKAELEAPGRLLIDQSNLSKGSTLA